MGSNTLRQWYCLLSSEISVGICYCQLNPLSLIRSAKTSSAFSGLLHSNLARTFFVNMYAYWVSSIQYNVFFRCVVYHHFRHSTPFSGSLIVFPVKNYPETEIKPLSTTFWYDSAGDLALDTQSKGGRSSNQGTREYTVQINFG